MLQIFIALKNPSPLARFELANFGSIGKHANHYTTEDDGCQPYSAQHLTSHNNSEYSACCSNAVFSCKFYHFSLKMWRDSIKKNTNHITHITAKL
jgi:hypothetical protein